MNWTLIVVLTIVISLPFIVSSIAIPVCLKIYKKKKLHALPIKDIDKKKSKH